MGMRIDVADPNPGRKPRAKPDEDFKPGTWGLTSSTLDTQRVSTCGVCGLGVYKTQPRVFSNGFDAPVGINHEECAGAVSAGG